MIDTDKEVKNILFDLGVEGNEYGDLVEYISNLLAEVKRLRELKIAEGDELEELCNRAIFYEDFYNLTLREKQKLTEEIKRLKEFDYEKWYWRLREYIGEEAMTDLYEIYAEEE